MPHSWNEIRSRAIAFSKEWETASSEDAEAKSFWDKFFEVFGISRRRVATFEQPVKRLDESTGYIDLLWKGTLMVEHKSRGRNLDKALIQAKEYFPGLQEFELPRYVLVSDFARFRLYDLDEGHHHEFELREFHKNVKLFGFIAGYQKKTFKEEDHVNIKAAEVMGRLHDKLKEVGYEGHSLELYLVRLLFCMFADDTGIFDKGIFNEYLDLKTNPDGSDLGMHIAQIFFILNTDKDKRLRNLDESLAQFPYVNGKLFEEVLPPASFDSKMRTLLLECCSLDWSLISPAIFGSLFQSVMNPAERRNLGAHYTSEKNILKIIKPLFLDDLCQEFESVKDNKNKLLRFHEKISALRFLDPACGCGNFLIIAYRELRLLEIEIIKALQKGQQVIDIENLVKLNVDRYYGIEYEEFPAQIAQVAMWLIDHQMNQRVSDEFGEYFLRLPLRKSAVIVCANSLHTDWHSLIDPVPFEKREQRFDFIFGNPPFVGKQMQNQSQKNDMEMIFAGVKGAGVIDYVACWYIKAAQYLQQYSQADVLPNPNQEPTRVAFVSTNSISQGEQVGILWNELFNKYKIKIHFAHHTFKWGNEARGKAAVHVVIIGFSNFDIKEKHIYEYEDIKGEPHELKCNNINPFLVAGNDLFLVKRRTPICSVPEISFGSMPNDGGFLILSDKEKTELLSTEADAEKFIRPLLSAWEFINGENRWCFWLKDYKPEELRSSPAVVDRINKVKDYRSKSTRVATKKLAVFPSLFGEDRQPKTNYILIPRHSSENRTYIPFGYFQPYYIASDSCLFIADVSTYHFGVIHSIMHMAWIKQVCGRLESRFRYSNEIVYNNFPWPENPTDKQIEIIEKAAQKVLDVRAEFPNSSLADLYDPLTMPPSLIKAHNELDKAVDLCYRPQPFINETKRIEFLFELYEKYTAGMFGEVLKKKRKTKNEEAST